MTDDVVVPRPPMGRVVRKIDAMRDEVKLEAADAAGKLTAALISRAIDSPQVIPTISGGVQLEWHRRGVDLEVYVDADGSTSLHYSGPDVETLLMKALMWRPSGAPTSSASGRSRRRTVTPALLQEVAAVYRQAFTDGLPPTVAVADHFGTSHSTAGRWVAQARKAGHLRPSVGPAAGETESVELLSGSAGEPVTAPTP